MIVVVTLNDPEGLNESITQQAINQLSMQDIPEAEFDDHFDNAKAQIRAALGPFFIGEGAIVLEIDTDTRTVRVA